MKPLPTGLAYLPFNDKIPGMVGQEQCQYLFWIARERSGSDGVIAEVGSWLGRSAWHLAKGAQRTIHCFDDFKWRSGFSKKCAIELNDGECFQHVFENNLRGEAVVAHKVSISNLRWDLGNINVLHVDSAKRTPEISALLTTVAPYLQTGSILILQDFCHEMSHDIPFAVALLKDYLQPLHSPAGGMVSFTVKCPIPAEAVSVERLSPASYSYKEKRALWRDMAGEFRGKDRRYLKAGLAFLLAEHEHWLPAIWQSWFSGMRRTFLERMLSADRYARYPAVFAAHGFRPPPGAREKWKKRRARKARLASSAR